MGRWVKGCSSLGEACQLSRIRNCWEMFERRGRRRGRGRGWSIVSSEERKGTGLCPPAPAPPPAGAKFSEGGKERVGSSSGLVHVGESLPPGLPASPQAPLSPLLLLFLRYLILFPATQLHPKAGARKLSDGDNNLTLK